MDAASPARSQRPRPLVHGGARPSAGPARAAEDVQRALTPFPPPAPPRARPAQGQHLWRFIHDRVCFQLRLDDPDNEWKNDFNRLVSGMHSAVAAHVVDGMPEERRLAEYRRRLRDQPDGVRNLHFGYMLLLCAVRQARAASGAPPPITDTVADTSDIATDTLSRRARPARARARPQTPTPKPALARAHTSTRAGSRACAGTQRARMKGRGGARRRRRQGVPPSERGHAAQSARGETWARGSGALVRTPVPFGSSVQR